MLRRLFVGLVALVLAVSVLVVSPVAVSPAGAANTASESLVNHDNNPATPQIRAFGGANRYATSVAIAEAFRANSGSGGFVDTVIVASGESLVDAAAAAGLAASEVAPVLLTPPGRLQRAVENFIVDEFVSEVFIVGGTASVSQAVEDAIAELAPVRTVTRLAGADRYGTAVAVAGEIGTPGVYCDTGQVTALLVNVDSSFSDVIAAGPLAYSLELPILLTPAGALPASVAGYLTDTEIERVVIVGGATAVSAAVVADINEAGVGDVVRISGTNRYDTALEIRQALSDCGTVTLSPTTFALVNASAAADGVAAGPLLGLGLPNDDGATNGVTPVLLVSGDGGGNGGGNGGLPADTRNYLRTLPIRNADASFVDVSLTAIGGAAVVSDTVVQAAIAAATTSSPITATITATAGSNTVRVTFSASVDVSPAPDASATAAVQAVQRAAFASSALNRVNYQVSGGPLVPGDTFVASNNNRTITIGLSGDEPLLRNAPVSVVDGKIKGFGGDSRRVEGAQVTARVLPDDRVRPRVEIFAPQGSHAIRIRVTEPNLATDVSTQTDDDGVAITDAVTVAATTTARQALLASIRIDNARLYVPVADDPATAGVDESMTLASVATVLPSSAQNAQNDITVCLFGDDGTSVCNPVPGTTPAVDDGNPREQVALGTGETITVAAGAFEDNQGNPSRSTTQRVTAFTSYPEVRRATVTSPVTLDIGPAAAPAPQVAQWRWQRYDSATPPVVDENVLTITAKPDSAAGGAPGNRWRVLWIGGTPATADTDTDPEVSVSVNKARETVLVSFDDDATIFSVVSALAADSEFDELFTVSSDVFTNSLLANEKITDNLTASATSVATCAAVPAADTTECGQPNTATPWTLRGGVSVVVVTLSYNETLSSFDYASLVAANQAGAKFPSAQRTASGTRARQLVGWQRDPFAADLDLDDEFSFLLTTSSATFADLPKSGDTISLPAELGTTFAYDSVNEGCRTGLSANSDSDPCGQSIAVDTPGQTLRRGSISGRIQGAETTVEPPVITATIDATAFLVTVVFSVPVDRATAEDTANYRIGNRPDADGVIAPGDNPLPEGTTVELSADRRTVTITFPVGEENELVDRQRFIVNGNAIRADGADDDDVTVDTTEIAAVLPPTTITARIAAELGELTFRVIFDTAVNDDVDGEDNFATSARNPANYQINDNPLPDGTTIGALTEDGTVATIELPAGSELVEGAVISIVANRISLAGGSEGDRRVAETMLTVQVSTDLITATVVAIAPPDGTDTITVTFSAPVKTVAMGGETGFRNSAANRFNYNYDDGPLPEGTLFVPSEGNTVVTITLPAGEVVVAGDEFNVEVAPDVVQGGGIEARFDSRIVQPLDPPFTVLVALTAEFFVVEPGLVSFTLLFRERVNVEANELSSDYGTSAHNPANYAINGAALLASEVTITDVSGQEGLQVQVSLLTSAYMRGLPDNARVEIIDGAIKAANDDRRVAGVVAEPGAASLPTATFSEGDESNIFTVLFTDFVRATPAPGGGATQAEIDVFAASALNPANYQLDGADLPADAVFEILTDNGDPAGGNAGQLSIELPQRPSTGSNLIVIGNRIIVADSNSALRVERSADYLVPAPPAPPAPLTAMFTTNFAECNIFRITFSEAANSATSTQPNYSYSVRNPKNYWLNGAFGGLLVSAGVAAVTITYDPPTRTVTVQLFANTGKTIVHNLNADEDRLLMHSSASDNAQVSSAADNNRFFPLTRAARPRPVAQPGDCVVVD